MSFFLGKRMNPHHYKNFYPFSSSCLFWLRDFPRRDRWQNRNGDCLESLLYEACDYVCVVSRPVSPLPTPRVESIFILQALPSLLWSFWVICSRDRQCSIFIALLICIAWGYVELTPASHLEYTDFEWCFHQRSWPHWILSFSFQFLFYLWLQHYHQQTFIECPLYAGFYVGFRK